MGNGRGGESIYGGKFPDEFENGIMEHSVPGLLSMANSGRNTNGSQFFVTCTKAKYLDGKHVVFGRVVGEGNMEVVRVIEGVGCRSGDTDSPVCITACGEVESTVVRGWTRRKNRSKKLSVVHQKVYVLTKEYFLVVSGLLVYCTTFT